MSRELFERKIKDLTDDRLTGLLRLSRNGNRLIVDLATEEARRRNLGDQFADAPGPLTDRQKIGDLMKLKKWNWGAFLLAPLWTLANKLDRWAIFCSIPGVNVIVMIYLGYKGNKLAYEKSDVGAVDDFMAIQKEWGVMAIKIFGFAIVLWLLFAVLAA